MSKKILIINGPNLNLLGEREQDQYGNLTLDEIKNYTTTKLTEQKVTLDWYQSNAETEIVERIQKSRNEGYDVLIINPGAFTHSSVAILDALSILSFPVVEVHLSQTHRRERFRSYRITTKAASAVLEGLGKDVYYLGILSQL